MTVIMLQLQATASSHQKLHAHSPRSETLGEAAVTSRGGHRESKGEKVRINATKL